MYGLKQAADNSYVEPANFLLRQGFIRSREDHSLFAIVETEVYIFNLVWVDETMVEEASL